MIETRHRAEPAESAAQELRNRAGLTSRLLHLADHLPEADRALLQAVYDRGMQPCDFARAVRQRPRAIQYRIRRIITRIGSPMFQFVVGQQMVWNEPRRSIAELAILRGVSQREVARRLGVSVHRVRQEVSLVRAQCEMQGRGV